MYLLGGSGHEHAGFAKGGLQLVLSLGSCTSQSGMGRVEEPHACWGHLKACPTPPPPPRENCYKGIKDTIWCVLEYEILP